MLISIITVNRNMASGLRATLDSIFTQSYSTIEVIVIDGASTDNSLDIIKLYADKNLHYVCEPDSGIYNAMNKAIPLAKGEYLYFLNSGDTFFSSESLLQAANKMTSAPVYYCNILLKSSTNSSLIRLYPNNLNYNFWIRSHLCHQAVFFHKSLFDEFGLYNEQFRFAADFEIIFRAWKKYKTNKFIYLDVILANYNLEGTSSLQLNRKKIRSEYRKIQKIYFPILQYLKASIENAINDYIYSSKSNLLRKIIKKIYFDYFNSHTDFYFPKQISNARPLRVLHLSTFVSGGGAGIAAHRLNNALIENGIFSAILVLGASFFDNSVYTVNKKNAISLLFFKFYKLFLTKITFLFKSNKDGFYSTGLLSQIRPSSLHSFIRKFKPDVIHIHWICGDFLHIKDLKKIEIPKVWTLHDMWPFLGVEHISNNDQYKTGFKSSKDFFLFNFDKYILGLKQKHWSNLLQHTNFIAPSNWMKSAAKDSLLLQSSDVTVIPNLINTKSFEKIDKSTSRNILKIDENNIVLLFGASSPFIDNLKGYDTFLLVLQKLRDSTQKQITLITFGTSWGKRCVPGIEHKHFEYVSEPEFLKTMYSAANITVVTSPVESFCLVAAESLACGTPVVCFNTSGLKDVVVHKKTGYLAELNNIDDLLSGINWVLINSNESGSLSEYSREYVAKYFSSNIVVLKHLDIYKKSCPDSDN